MWEIFMPHPVLHPQDALHYAVHTQQADREHYSWPYGTRRPGFLKSLPVSAASVLELCPSFLEWGTADRRGLSSNDALTASMFCGGVRTVLTLPPFFLTVELVSSKLFTDVFTAWADGHFNVSMNPEFLAKFTSAGNVAIAVRIKWFYGESTLYTGPRLNFKLNAIHGHATWQHHSLSPLML